MTCQELQQNPTPELQEFLNIAQALAVSGGSTARKDFLCDDAVLVVMSRDGGSIQYSTEPLPPAPASDAPV